MKYMKYLAALTVFLSLTACSHKEEIPQPDPFPYNFGYFRGSVNGKPLSLQNDRNQDYIRAGSCQYYYVQDDCHIRYGFTVPLDAPKNDTLLSVILNKLEPGTYPVGFGDYWNFEDRASIAVRQPDGNFQDIYLPSEQKVQVTLTKVTFRESSYIPWIEGTVEGTFSNPSNPQDQVVIGRSEFGSH